MTRRSNKTGVDRSSTVNEQALARVSYGVSDDGTIVRFDLATFDGRSFTFYCNDETVREFLRGVSGGVDEMKLRMAAVGFEERAKTLPMLRLD
jgi:hypothetical protein